MNWVVCVGCGRQWYQRHRDQCPEAARQFVADVTRDGGATAEDNPRCPKCGQEQTDWTERCPRNVCDGSEWLVSCDGCNFEYPVELVIIHKFHVQKPA